ncbi:ABC-type transport auxiliary lipoprotein family protein [Marinobacter orientalis]|uniref:ABC-type transport auxiliary lipoprotein component domain-containing protein n=1 Tax=Marinobacter orientalis TaxID=1928859 RepID=A0A7Y0REL7_9GAMM|nr:ABC-type transport auxiliary lipoprotein family protein [Marinobacter orientalis]NMT64798.1 hypothetical protein [Marinobacter orientalis]TGX48789.1 hypothetical protein DIT72_12235 [Marinobacter orientalis]
MIAPLMRRVIAAAATLSLTACTVFPDQPAHQIFQLPAPAVQETAAESVDRTLRVTTPLAVAPIDSNRILVKPDAHEIRAYEGARWSNRSPIIVGNYLLESFRQDGRLATVVGNTSPARSDLTLAGDLTRFQAEYPGGEHRNGNPVVHLELNLQLINERSRETLASKHFGVTRPANGEDVASVVEAFGKASDELARQVIEWTAEQL